MAMTHALRAQARRSGKLRLSRDKLHFALFLLIVLAVSRVHLHIPGLAAVRPILLLTVAVTGLAFANPKLLAPGSFLATWPAKVVLALGVVACLSVPFGISIGNSGRFVIEVYSKIVILTLLLIAACRSVRDLYTYAWGYVVASGIITFFALFVFRLQRYDAEFGYARLANLYTWDANDVVLVLLVGLALALLVMQSVRDVPRRAFCALVLLFIGATVARSGSRGGFLGLMATGVALLFLTSGVSLARKALVIAVAVAGLVFWAPEGYWQQMETIKNPTADYNYTSVDGRKSIARRGIGYMLSRPFFGVGIANFEKAECTISEKAKRHRPGTGLRCMPPHNSYVQAGAETGIPGLVLWSSLIFGGIVGLRRLGKRLPRRFRTGTEEERFLYYACQYLPVALVGFGATAYFLTFAWLEPYYMLAAMVAGTIACANQARHQELLRLQGARAARAPRPAPVPALVPATPVPVAATE